MTEPNEKHHFFNQVAIGETDWCRIKDADAESRSKAVLETITPVAEGAHSLKFQQTSHTWVGNFWRAKDTRPKFSYSAELPGHVVEVVDIAPDASAWSKEDGHSYSINRLIGIYEKDKKPGIKGAIFMSLSPNYSPRINVLTADDGSNAGFLNQGASAPLVVAVAQKIIDAVNDGVPLPEWAVDFDQNFVIENRTIFKKPAPTPAADSLS